MDGGKIEWKSPEVNTRAVSRGRGSFSKLSRDALFENRVLRRIYGPKRNADGEWRRRNNQELHYLYRPPNIVRMIRSRRLRWAGHVARMEEGGVLSKF